MKPMMICKKCGQTFDEPFNLGVDHEAGNEPVYACPHCRHLLYTEAVWCTMCETWYDPDKIDVVEGVCETCLDHYYNSYIAMAELKENANVFSEFMEWMGLPSLLEGGLKVALNNIRTTTWKNDERKEFLRKLHEFMVDDVYWYVTHVLPKFRYRYDFGAFKARFDFGQFLLFLECNWDQYFPVHIWFAKHFYGTDMEVEILAKSLIKYIHSYWDVVEKGNTTLGDEIKRYTDAMMNFVRDCPWVGIAYCIWWEDRRHE